MKTTKPITEARAYYESPVAEVISCRIEANICSPGGALDNLENEDWSSDSWS